MTSGDMTPDADADRVISELSQILRTSLQTLSESGSPDDACRLAARACASLRQPQREQWHIFNKLLHKLSRRSEAVGIIARAGTHTSDQVENVRQRG